MHSIVGLEDAAADDGKSNGDSNGRDAHGGVCKSQSEALICGDVDLAEPYLVML